MLHPSPSFTFIEAADRERSVPVAELLPQAATIASDLRQRLPAGAVVGLVFRSEPILVLAWIACLHAGLRPLVMQYPTKKQSRLYWLDSVSNTIARSGLAALLCDEYCAGLGVGRLVETVVLPPMEAIASAPAAEVPHEVLPAQFAIMQLSSGTTGFRKAIEFRSDDLRRHVQDYNQILRLDPARDRIVSWLPLYHDMGYVACFVMPLMLGIDTVMMDPMTWVQDPGLLFHAIGKHAGTIAYLPNFGFEVMSRATPRPMPSMRLWISCSEPVSPATSRNFLARIGAPEDSFAACYAMAENIFAVSIGRGIRTAPIEGRDVISCGAPIPGVEVKLVEDEIWIRSPTSLRSYVGGEDIRDADGFYPTGDLGRILDGEIYVTGRKHDLLIQAGRKFMLSDIDLIVNEAFPGVKGRVATVTMEDERLGTQKPLVLIEAADFYRRRDMASVADRIRAASGLDQVEVAYVPPRFLTKTSSGKINRRKSAQDWLARLGRPDAEAPAGAQVEAEFRHYFGHLDWDAPVGDILDSLSLTVLRIILGDAGIAYDAARSLNGFLAEAASDEPAASRPEAIYIVSLADAGSLRHLRPEHVARLSRLLGAPVVVEHVCLPPSAIILSDLVFQDWFLPRVDRADYAVVERQLNKLRRASLILVDDVAEMLFPPAQVYGVLSHAFERDPRADLVAVRWQRYPQMHHRLPLTVVSGADLPLADRTETIARLSDYLGTPIFRMAFLADVAEFTEGWDFRPFETRPRAGVPRYFAQPAELVNALAAWIRGRPVPLRRTSATAAQPLEISDLAHFCSRITDRDAIERVLARYDRFCIVGQDASIPYLAPRIAALGKSLVRAGSYAPDVIGPLQDSFDCMLICGPQGRYPITTPAVALMAAESERQTWNITDPEITRLGFVVPSSHAPASGTDWLPPPRMARDEDREVFAALRQGVRDFHLHQRRRVIERRRRLAAVPS
ncbi:MAG: AMP-binding protein [Acetobacteraceae bacterium]